MKGIEMKVPELIIEALNEGVEVTMRHHAIFGIGFDVNTRAKSHVVLYQNGQSWIAHMRYGEKKEVENFYDLACIVKSAMHGRDYVDSAWQEIFIKRGIVET